MTWRTWLAFAGVALVAVPAFGVTTSGCLDRDLRPLNPCVVSGVVRRIKATNIDKVDLLFMVDNSNSMAEEQASLSEQFPRLVRVLATGDQNGDGIQEFPPVNDLHIGVINSDMGVGGFNVPTCNDEPNFGDDGILRTTGNVSIPGCMATYPNFLTFMPGSDDPDTFATDVSCVARMGTGGCGFEQQLEAVLKAVTPSTSSVTFNMGTVGHGDGANAGFVRPNSLLAVVLVTDEDDCSAVDPEIFNPSSVRYSGDLNLRCYQFPDAVHGVDRFVQGLLALRSDQPDLLVYAAITGVPTDLVADTESVNFNAILDDPRMQEQIDDTMPTRLQPSCSVPGRGVAFPPRRIVTVAQRLEEQGSNGIVQSICQADFTPALNAIIAKIADVLGGACLPRPLNPDETGRVNCDVVEIMPLEGDFTRCEQLASLGREATPVRREADGREVCRVTQIVPEGDAVPAGAVGWYYDDFTADVMTRCAETPHRISFTTGAEPKTGVTVRLECLQSVLGGGASGESVQIGTACSDGGDGLCASSAVARGMICDAGSQTCQINCASNADCPGGFVCDRERVPGDASRAICVNPTCEI